MDKALKVLIVEDTPADVELAVAVLSKTWPELTHRSAETAQEFRDAVAWNPDIIIADYEVPGFGAVAALGILHDLDSDIPLIVFTGAVTEEIVVRCMRLGAADYLLKDRLTRLASAIDNALTMRRERHEKERTEREQRRLAGLNSAILNSLPALIALLDAEGRIVAVNEAWRASKLQGGLVNSTWSIGNNYVTLCGRTEGNDALAMTLGLRGVLDGTHASYSCEHDAQTANGKHWFRMTVTPVRGGGAVVMHLDITDRKSAEDQVEFLSRHDTLTKLPNRSALQQRLHRVIAAHDPAQGAPVMFFIELDRFKTVNDTLGHPVGDALLRAVAKRLSDRVRGDEMLARLGGDEFVLLVPQLQTADESAAVAEHLRISLERPFKIGEHELFITASIGISCYPQDGRDFEAMLRTADAAVYRAKRSGRNAVAFYSAEIDAAAQERFVLQNGLPHALARGEFILEYQPTIDLRNNAVTGVEALIRWRHPQLGLVPPSRFIDLAEDTGLIIPISEWVLRTALLQAKHWINAGWSHAAVAVNLSVRQFTQPNLAVRIAEILASIGVQPSCVRLEVTESMVMEDPLMAAATLEHLGRMGIQMALDDFGTGYSSLSFLKRFRLACLKVDRSFVSGTPGNAGDESIVHAVVALGKTLGMKIIAEGVETRAQASFLRDAGCDDAQGYYYARPVDSEEVLKLVTAIPAEHCSD